MRNTFSFYLLLEDTEDQSIVFKRDGESPVTVKVQDKKFSKDIVLKLTEMYRVLVDMGLVDDVPPTFVEQAGQ